MVQIYLEPIGVRHYARWLSSAVFLRTIGILGAIVLSFTLAYTSGGIWLKAKTLYEQPGVTFNYGMLVILEGAEVGDERLWSSYPDERDAFGDKLISMSVKAQEYDDNHDGKPDVITITGTASGAGMPIHSAKVLLDFTYTLKTSVDMLMAATVYITHSSSVPGAALYTYGELGLVQRDPLPAHSRRTLYNESLLIPPSLRGVPLLQQHQQTVQGILGANLARNETATYRNMQPVWLAGDGQEFVLSLTFEIPSSQAVVVRPRPIEMLKWGWVQFLATLALIWYLLGWSEYVLFHFRILPTRVVSDLERKKHRF